MEYITGQYQTFRAITKIHLGALESNLEENEVIQFDGSVMIRGNEQKTFPSLRAAIKVGWLVPEGTVATYTPQPANVKVHSAKNMSGDQEQIQMKTVIEEERGLGTLQEVRPENAPQTHVAKNAGTQHTAKVDTSDGEGRVVGRFKSSAISNTVEIGKDDRRVVESLDNKSKLEVEKIATATGDVDTAIVGETLEDILPNAATTTTPESGVAGEGQGDQSQERAELVVEETETPLSSTEVANLKIEMLTSLVPDFTWDLTAHWKTRVSKALTYKDNPIVLNQILSFESETVVKHVNNKLQD